MKDGLIYENDELVYYQNGNPYHAGVIEVEGNIYYISSNGRAVKGQHIVHGAMTNGIIKKGTYTFGDDYKLVANSYIAPKKRKKNNRLLRKFKKRARKIVPVGLSIAAIILLVALISYRGANNTPTGGSTPPTQSTSTPAAIISLPAFDEDILLCSETAK